MNKKIVLSCIVAMTIATFIGKKGIWAESNEANKLLIIQNVDALSEGDNRETSYIRTDGKCEYKISGLANGEMKVYLAGVQIAKIKLGADGTATYSYDGKTDCAADGKQMCSPRYCPQLSFLASE
ncbi:MAG: hypothetical protein K2J00_01995 [Bacteroidaceae bacterium]|nr:hypothetical protein [Bacteroidaceae bacterium]